MSDTDSNEIGVKSVTRAASETGHISYVDFATGAKMAQTRLSIHSSAIGGLDCPTIEIQDLDNVPELEEPHE